ncbi:MAG: hypothetical protein ABS46_07340 [Cytophagaceae bacterium SCN 52-12]|nr:MAG: hypothetical protein ABS46_07340 [Cytophagaceae bacterium SCN 52-12]
MKLKLAGTGNLPFLLTLLPILLHFTLIALYSRNVPWIDDFYWYFDFLTKTEDAGFSWEAVRILVTSYHNHWHIVQRLILLPVVKMTGGIPIVPFVWLGNLLYLALFYLLFLRERKGKPTFTPRTAAAAWLFFQPVSYYNFFECAFFNLPVLLFSFLAIEAFVKQGNRGIGWAVLATFSNGNGMLVWPVAILIAAAKKDWKAVARYTAIFAAFSAAYLRASHGTSGPGRFSLTPFHEIVLYFLQLTGSVGGLDAWWATTLAGVLLLGIFALSARAMLKKNPAVWYFTVFLLMSIAIISLTRREVSGFSAEIVRHYLMFPQILLVVVACGLADWKKLGKAVQWTLACLAMSLSLVNYGARLPEINGYFALKTANLLNYEKERKWRLYPPIQGNEEYRKANAGTATAIARGYYRLPALKREYLASDCALKPRADGSVAILASLPSRMLFKTIMAEVTSPTGETVILPVDPNFDGFLSWLRRKKGARADMSYAAQLMNERFVAGEGAACRLFAVTY